MLDGQGAKFDALKFNWLGSIARAMSVCITWHTTNFHSLDDVMQREMRLSATGIAGWRVIAGRMLNIVAGTKFRVVTGYGPNEDYLAIERGEVEGSCTTYDTLQATQFEWLSQKKVRFIAQFGKKPEPDLGSGNDGARSDQGSDRPQGIRSDHVTAGIWPPLCFAARSAGRPRAGVSGRLQRNHEGPRVPGRGTERSHLWLDSLTAEEMETLIKSAYATPAETIQRAKAILAQAQRSN